ncbi:MULTISPECIES: outer membrane protein [unclassified Brevundimonas]|uniref:outer membrane protein n=1 Tax=unclassified Brevundimonas TaxID=2622653 RepID=UPI0006F95CB7|nr:MULTISPECIES: outer membrane beta-barrel protein [unclassified Brevundimonas]KQY95579.1 porin [Brevundimonas sp. Root1423]KRA28264.1 porin [Brevundimonas sp. Root608]
MYKTLSAASLAVLLAGVAAPALAQSAPDWSGPYIGVYGGVAENNEDAGEGLVFDRDLDGQFDDTVVLNGTTTNAFTPGSCDGAATAQAVGNGCDIDPTGVEGSIRAGYDMQFGPIVVGLVGELSAVDLEDSVTSFSSTPAAYVFTRQVEQMAALRARIGFPVGPALFYATAGAAKAKVENSFRTTNTANSFTETVNENDADGYQLGGGVEWKLAPNLSLTGEYLYSNLQPGDYVVRAGPGTAPATNPFILAPNTVGTDITRSNDGLELHALRVGMNVRF